MRVAFVAFSLSLLSTACAQVPKESVQLSAAIGRDLASVHESHRRTVHVLFSRMRADVNRFVDKVYAPAQVKAIAVRQAALATSADPAERQRSFIILLQAAAKPDTKPEILDAVLKATAVFLQKVRSDIDGRRSELLAPLTRQEEEITRAIDAAYGQLRLSNAVLTSYLASLVKVNDAQDEVLRSVGVQKDLRTDVGTALADASDKIGTLVEKAEATDDSLAKAEESVKQLQNALGELGKALPKGGKD